jgi:hypothetical protein
MGDNKSTANGNCPKTGLSQKRAQSKLRRLCAIRRFCAWQMRFGPDAQLYEQSH